MCEHFVARAAEPFRIDELWPFADRLERFGIAGFGWGAGWLAGNGALSSHRDTRAFREDAARDVVGRQETTALLVHLRRPSKLSTLGLADTQPFDDPAGRFVFSHNGDFKRHPELRDAYRRAGRIHGKADTEVGARWLEDAWREGEPVGALLARLHETFEGLANLALITRGGAAYHYAGNADNPVFTFCLGRIEVASTGIYSLDRSLFKFVAPGARDRRLVPRRATVSLGKA
jgi:glutamine phosphoribosylpyrophosphate amidotransferase